MTTITQLLEWCLERQKEGKIFEKWTKLQLACELIERMKKRELVVAMDGDKIAGACVYRLIPEKKEVFIDNIVTVERKYIWPMFVQIFKLNSDVDLTGWNFTGTHRSGRKRKFIVNKNLINKFAKI